MNSLWDEEQVTAIADDPLALRVYTSRLLGREPSLVLHGGGNTSLKDDVTNLFGDTERILFVKGSGWDLASIEKPGFAPVRLDVLKKMVQLEVLSDSDMVNAQRAAMINPNAPNPSVEAILHAIIPFTFVDHTHADAVVTISNTADGEARLQEIYGDEVLILPYIMPGFMLARQVYQRTAGIDWSHLKGIVLMHHGLFTFANDGRESYENMIELVSKAEDFLDEQAPLAPATSTPATIDLMQLAVMRQAVSLARATPVLAWLDSDAEAVDFSARPDVADITARGPLTPDHVIRTKRTAMMIGDDAGASVSAFSADYDDYFRRNNDGSLTCLDPAPRWALWPRRGALSFGTTPGECQIIADISRHTMQAIARAEALGGWQALPEKDIFELEYWELEQAKLKQGGSPRIPWQGRAGNRCGQRYRGSLRGIAIGARGSGGGAGYPDRHHLAFPGIIGARHRLRHDGSGRSPRCGCSNRSSFRRARYGDQQCRYFSARQSHRIHGCTYVAAKLGCESDQSSVPDAGSNSVPETRP